MDPSLFILVLEIIVIKKLGLVFFPVAIPIINTHTDMLLNNDKRKLSHKTKLNYLMYILGRSLESNIQKSRFRYSWSPQPQGDSKVSFCLFYWYCTNKNLYLLKPLDSLGWCNSSCDSPKWPYKYCSSYTTNYLLYHKQFFLLTFILTRSSYYRNHHSCQNLKK